MSHATHLWLLIATFVWPWVVVSEPRPSLWTIFVEDALIALALALVPALVLLPILAYFLAV